MLPKIYCYFVLFILSLHPAFAQEMIRPLPDSVRAITTSRPVQPQWKGNFNFDKAGITVSNDFSGGRLNGIILEGDTLVALISAENTPINMSPWYAFKIWSEKQQRVWIKLSYDESARHRYYPKISSDGLAWQPLDSADFMLPEGESFKTYIRPKTASFQLEIGPDTLWVAGQELMTMQTIYDWSSSLAEHADITEKIIGESVEGRAIRAMEIGRPDNKRLIMIIGRQHPPEVTGQLALQTFVETISADNQLANRFRNTYTTIVVPMVNPDGVENGHWRHNSHGIDLNRDWAAFNQPETRAVRDFMHQKISGTVAQFYFGIDFHSTWQDIYYTVDDSYDTGNVPGLVPLWLSSVKMLLQDYELNIRPNASMEPTLVSRNYFYITFGAESLVYEIGDNTPRDFLAQKSQIGAEELMKLLLGIAQLEDN